MNEIGPRPEELERGVRCLAADFDGNGAVDFAIPGAEGRATILMNDEAGLDHAVQIDAGGLMELYQPRASVGPLGEPVSRNHGILVRWVGQDHAVFVWSGKGFDRKLFSAVRADDRARLLELHAEAMEAHRAGDIELLLKAESQEYVVASRGRVSHPTLEDRRAALGPYLRETRFSEYVDVVPPVVKVSRDGTLGWVIVQVRARGEQAGPGGATQPVEFESAWIELYEKLGNEWRRVGNVSNFKE
jgi:Domain of unknown function (DUF4440)